MININELSQCKFIDRQSFPKKSGIYIVHDVRHGDILYVGQSQDICSRWSIRDAHHRDREIRDMGDVNDKIISWILCDKSALDSMEKIAIRDLHPRLNRTATIYAGHKITLSESTYADVIDDECFATVDYIAECLRISRKSMVKMINRKEIHARLIDDQWMIGLKYIKYWIECQKEIIINGKSNTTT